MHSECLAKLIKIYVITINVSLPPICVDIKKYT